MNKAKIGLIMTLQDCYGESLMAISRSKAEQRVTMILLKEEQ